MFINQELEFMDQDKVYRVTVTHEPWQRDGEWWGVQRLTVWHRGVKLAFVENFIPPEGA